MSRPTRNTPGGRAYLDLQRLAREQRRPTDELQRLYALEGFLARLAASPHAERLILKGGVLLAAYDTRRPTRDVDLEALHLSNDVEHLLSIVRDILRVRLDDGLVFDPGALRPEIIRDGDTDLYSGVRILLTAGLASAKLSFGIDVSVGDPIVPEPRVIDLPRLLNGGSVRLKGYPLPMVLAEKIITALQRGTANTRWRDFADIYLLVGRHDIDGPELLSAITAVAEYRRIRLRPLSSVLQGFAELEQARWRPWQRRNNPDLPTQFADVLGRVFAFADPVLQGSIGVQVWRPGVLGWD